MIIFITQDGIGIQFPKTVRAKATEVTMAADKARHLDDTTKTSSANMAPQRPQRTTATVQRFLNNMFSLGSLNTH